MGGDPSAFLSFPLSVCQCARTSYLKVQREVPRGGKAGHEGHFACLCPVVVKKARLNGMEMNAHRHTPISYHTNQYRHTDRDTHTISPTPPSVCGRSA